MKFCPNCGSVRNGKDVCDCGYDYNSGEIKEVENKKDGSALFMYMNNKPKTLEEFKKKTLDFGDLLSFSFVSSGGMLGSFHCTEIIFKDLLLNVVDQEWHHGDKIRKVYKVDEKSSKEIKKILVDNNFGAWNEAPVNNSIIAFDAPTGSMYLRFEKKIVSVLTTICMDKEMSEVFFKVKNLMQALSISDENKISEEILTDGQIGFMPLSL